MRHMKIDHVALEAQHSAAALSLAILPSELNRALPGPEMRFSVPLVDRLGQRIGDIEMEFLGVSESRAIYQAVKLHPADGSGSPASPSVRASSTPRLAMPGSRVEDPT
jgi:hypothetical protein